MQQENQRLLMPRQDEQDCPAVRFYDGQMMLSMTTLAGTKIEAMRSAASVREAFTGIPVDSGWLAPNVVRWGDGGQGEWAVLFVPPGPHDLELTTEAASLADKVARVRVPLPAMVVFGGGTKYWVWALRSERFEPYHELYRAPLPNVKIDAEVCWGPHRPPASSGRDITRAWELFTSTTFSSHAAAGKSKRNGEDVREVLKGLADANAERYPVEDLVRYSPQGGISIDTIIRAFINNGKVGSEEEVAA